MMAEQDNDETRACGLWLYMTRMLSWRHAMVAVSMGAHVHEHFWTDGMRASADAAAAEAAVVVAARAPGTVRKIRPGT